MEYKAKWGVDGGISEGFGLRDKDYVEIEMALEAGTDQEAMQKAINHAIIFSLEHLSNPDTEKTSLKLLSLREKDRTLDQTKLIPEQTFRPVKLEEGLIVAECNTIEHLCLTPKRYDEIKEKLGI